MFQLILYRKFKRIKVLDYPSSLIPNILTGLTKIKKNNCVKNKRYLYFFGKSNFKYKSLKKSTRKTGGLITYCDCKNIRNKIRTTYSLLRNSKPLGKTGIDMYPLYQSLRDLHCIIYKRTLPNRTFHNKSIYSSNIDYTGHCLL